MKNDPQIVTNTLVISDVHLRSKNCHAKLLLDTLKKYDYKTLLIVGDLIEQDGKRYDNIKMNWHQFQFVEYLRKILDEKNTNKKIVRIGGNHDSFESDFINQVLGIKTIQEYEWIMAEKKFYAIHGHQFDKFTFEIPFLTKIAVGTFLFMQKIDTKKKIISRTVDRLHSKWMRLTEGVALGAKELARRKNADVIICGHTHEVDRRTFNKDGRTIEYLNSGDWTGHQCSYITIDENGVMNINNLIAKDES